jgi:ABC-type lipoprotein release transport system permease subunit
MARSPVSAAAPSAIRRRRARIIPSSFTLATWRLRQVWKLLLIAGLGNIAAVLLVCVVPLFTQIALDAGVRNALSKQSGSSQIFINAFAPSPTQQDISALQKQLDGIFKTDMGPYVASGEPQFSVTLPFVMVAQNGSASSGGPGMQIVGYEKAQEAAQYSLISGRLPSTSGSALEIALTQSDVSTLGAHVGDTLHATIPGQQPIPLDLRLVGIVALRSSADQSSNQQGQFAFGNGGVVYGGQGGFMALAANQAIIAWLSAHPNSQGKQEGPPPQLEWTYQLDTSHMSSSGLNDILDRLSKVQTDVSGRLNNVNGLQGIYLNSGALQALSNLRIQILVLQIPLLLLLLQVIALVLLFIRMMAELLVDRQAEAIATLRSRGATRRQIFNAFTLHNIGLSLIALVVGPLIAIPLVRALSLHSLPPASQSAVDVISGNPFVVAYGLKWYVLVAVVAASAAMIFSTNSAASNNILTLRRENARTTTKPFWQRLNLDLIFGAIAVIGYTAYTLAVREVDPRIQLILSPISLIASLLMLIAALLLFLRLLPLLLGLGSRMATRGRGASSMLALTQMARAPKQPIRMTLLLALAAAFTLFTLVYSASQAQRLIDVAAFQTGADFTGTLSPVAASKYTFANLTAKYRQIPGVTSATLGYTLSLNPNSVSAGIPLQISAVDADTYAQSALWSNQESAQPLSDLMAQLQAARSSAKTQDYVPAIVDDATWQALRLTPGARFTVQPPGYSNQSMTLLAVARTHLLPNVYDSFQGGGFNGNGGLLVDYQSYATVYYNDLASSGNDPTIIPNTAWLATHDDTAALASARKALGSGDLALTSLRDYHQNIDNQRNNPLQIDLANTLLIGAATALLLALIGIWSGSWLNARSRVVNFAVLRALGTTPNQLRSMLVWEQVIVYITGAVLGLVLGVVLSLSALPLLIFAELATVGNFQNVPDVPPARVIVPGVTLSLAIGALILICFLALILTMSALARLSLGQTLRLNED